MVEKISMLVDGRRFARWENVNLNLSLDSIDTFGFSTPFQAENLEFRSTFQPLSYRSLEIRLNDEPIMNGVLAPKSAGLGEKSVSLGGYSRPGLLNSLPVPFDRYPLEFKNQDLQQIARQLGDIYDVDVLISEPIGAPFEAVSPEPAQKILEFLAQLAKKRSVLFSNTLSGELKFFTPGRSSVSTPLRQGEMPLLAAKIDIDEDNYFTSVTGLGAAQAGRDPEAFTVPLPAFPGVNRPFVYAVSEATGAELEAAVRFKAGRIFANAFKISVDILGWRGVNNKIWTPGDFILLRSPNIFFYNEIKLMIRGAALSRTAGDETANLELVFPGTYSGELPTRFPWD